MTFGNLGESFELVAIKSAGIPLLRFMRPLLVISVVISILAFLISNYVMPVANLKFTTMLYDIRVAESHDGGNQDGKWKCKWYGRDGNV